ncbi:MAG: pyridoxamine 5'-phosphate oxidase [Bacteroidetes bacterium]|nr:pyridoxamine 5'-phosphate oxidase [Bacteroidota bacterium]
MRESYEAAKLLETDCHKNPFIQFDAWFQEALNDQLVEPNAMQIATVGKNMQPSIRTVLLKSFDENGFVFFTNYESKKGIEIAENEHVALLFWYREHQRQIRIEGIAQKTAESLNTSYFYERPHDSQLAAYVSQQSQVVKDRPTLDNLFIEQQHLLENKIIPKKENWGGYVITPNLFEFWQGRANRFHDRIQYQKTSDNAWIMERLMP